MSHNKIKVGTATPNNNGELPVTLGDLSNVNDTNKADGVVLRSVAGTWVVSTSVTSDYEAGGYAAGWSTLNSGSSSSYTDTGTLNSYRTHDKTNWEDTDASVQITHGGLDLDRGTEGGSVPSATRFSRIVLDEGKYLLIGQTMARGSSSSSWIEFQWRDTNTNAILGPRWRQYGAAVRNIGRGYAYVEVTAGNTRTVDMRVVAKNGTVYDNPHQKQDDLIAALQLG